MKILVVGASGLLGREIVSALQPNHDVLTASRSGLDLSVDISDKDSIRRMFVSAGELDAVVCVAGAARFSSLQSLSDADFSFSLENKLMGQVNIVRCAVDHLRRGGSVTLTSGVLAQYPVEGSAAVSIANAGVEAFTRSAALELAGTMRVNVVSPGWISETLKAMGKDPADGVRASEVANAFVRSVEGQMNGEVIHR